jgi:hypothetical protein
MKTPEDIEGAYGTALTRYQSSWQRITAFAGIATSEVVLRNGKKEWFLRKVSVKWSRRSTTGGIITSTRVKRPGEIRPGQGLTSRTTGRDVRTAWKDGTEQGYMRPGVCRGSQTNTNRGESVKKRVNQSALGNNPGGHIVCRA